MQKYANLVELEKCCQTHIFLQNFVLIQPRTSPPKICKSLQKKKLQILPILLFCYIASPRTRPAVARRAGGAGPPRGRRPGGRCGGLPVLGAEGADDGLRRVALEACVFSNLYANFWIVFGPTFGYFVANFERLVLGCITAKFCKYSQ